MGFEDIRRTWMLEGLDAVDWGSLKGVYGPATEVPGFLRALTSEDEDVRMEASHELLVCLWHQGDVFPASAAAVPFLFELLTHPDVSDKGYSVELIAAIATGWGPMRGVRPGAEEMWRSILARRGKTLEEGLEEEEEEMLKAVHDAVSTGLHHLVPYLSNVEHQLPVAQALGNFPEHASWLVPAIDAALPSISDAYVRRVLAQGRARLSNTDGAA
jgi:hypothetical protein